VSIKSIQYDVFDSPEGSVDSFWSAASGVLEDRKVSPPNEESSSWKTILDEVTGENDECMFIYLPGFTGLS
jgi:hypothetical protein